MDATPLAPGIYKLGAFNAALKAARLFPRAACRPFAAALGRIVYRHRAQAQRAIHENLAVATGLKGAALDSLCRRNITEFSMMLSDYFTASSARPSAIRSQVHHWDGRENLDAAMEVGRGAIAITAHLGNWELGALILATEGLPMNIVTLEEPGSGLTEWRGRYRQRLGIKTIALGSNKFAFVEMMNALRRNEVVAMLVDRPYEGSGVPVTFFGRPTQFSTGPALLWQHTGAAVVPAFVIHSGRGRYRSLIQPAIEMVKTNDAAADVATNTQRIASRFESLVRQYPEQWFNYVPLFSPSSA